MRGERRTRRFIVALCGIAGLAAAPGIAAAPVDAAGAGAPITEYDVGAGHRPTFIANGPDGKLWFTDPGGGGVQPGVGRISTAGAVETHAIASAVDPLDVAPSPDGAMSLTDQGANRLLRLDTGFGLIDTGNSVEGPRGVTAGPGGKVWFTNQTDGSDQVCRIDPSLDVNASLCTSMQRPGAEARGIAEGPDGAVWFAEGAGNAVGRASLADGPNGPYVQIEEFPLTNASSYPDRVTRGPDGWMWFTERDGQRIGRIDPASKGIVEFPTPANSQPEGITSGPDGALWFAEEGANKIGRITTSGAITESDVPTANASPTGIAAGPDGALWFTEPNAGKVGRLAPGGGTTPPPTAKVVLATPKPVAGRVLALDPTQSVAVGGPLSSIKWDLDGSGRFAGSCPPSTPVAYKAFETPGSHVIGLKVTDQRGQESTTRLTVNVNRLAGVRTAPARSAGGKVNANPYVALKHFWCGDRRAIAAAEKIYLPKFFTTDVRAVGIDVSQGVVPDPPRPGGISILEKALVSLRGGASPRGALFKRLFALDNDQQNPRDNRITWMQKGGKTIVRVYASAIQAPNGKSVSNVQMKLYGVNGGQDLPGSPLLSQTGPLTVPTGPPFTTHAMRIGYSPADGTLPVFTFTLPDSWTQGNLALLAAPTLVGARLDAQCDTLDCKLNQQTGSGQLQFNNTGLFIIRSVAMKPSADPPLASPSKLFDQAINLSPVAVLPSPYQATIDIDSITKCKKASAADKSCDDPNGAASGLIGNWYNANKVAPLSLIKSMTIGIHSGYSQINGYSSWPGKCDENANGGAICETEDVHPVSQVDAGRPLTSVGHEMFHDLGRPHADNSASGCGGNGEGKPDSRGHLRGIGLDRHAGSGGSTTEPYRILSPDLPGQKSEQYDIMSYCTNNYPDDDSWLSPHNWDTVAGDWIFFLKRATASAALRTLARPAAGPGLDVSGYADGTGTHLSHVAPAAGGAAASIAAAPASSAFRAVARGTGGGVVGSVPLFVTYGHLDARRRGQPSTPFASFHGVVPATGAQRLEIIRDGSPATAASRSARAPRVRLLAPRRGTIGRGRTVVVRWRATDADGGALSAYVDYSTDGGRRWRTVSIGPNRGRAVLSSGLFTGSRRARVRVRVNDGFNETAGVSGPLRAVGSPPAVTIEPSRRRLRIPADATLALRGHAFDDAFRLLRGRSLRWATGRRVLARGEGVGVSGLTPGSHVIRLVARDRAGREGSAAVRVQVTAVRPFFVSLSAPRRLARGARSVRLKLATNVASVLRAGGRRYALSRRGRTVTVRVRPGRGTLALGLRLSAGRKAATKTLRIPR